MTDELKYVKGGMAKGSIGWDACHIEERAEIMRLGLSLAAMQSERDVALARTPSPPLDLRC